jgi:hypothetical protein
MAVCINCRKINDLCGNFSWRIPNIVQTLERIGSKKLKVLAKFDMTSGYFQMAFDTSTRDAFEPGYTDENASL